MIADKDLAQTQRQAEARMGTRQLTERTSPTGRMSEPAADKAVRYPTVTKEPRCQGVSLAETFTVVEARIDVGPGNARFIRGQGDGLSWEKGKPLSPVDASTWVWVTDQAQDRVVFKLLLNDQVWARGQDSVVEAGRKIELVPKFR